MEIWSLVKIAEVEGCICSLYTGFVVLVLDYSIKQNKREKIRQFRELVMQLFNSHHCATCG